MIKVDSAINSNNFSILNSIKTHVQQNSKCYLFLLGIIGISAFICAEYMSHDEEVHVRHRNHVAVTHPKASPDDPHYP